MRTTAYGTFFRHVSGAERYILLTAGPLAFAVYAYVALFAMYSARNVAVWLSTVLAVGLAALIGRTLVGPAVFGQSPWAPPAEPESREHPTLPPTDKSQLELNRRVELAARTVAEADAVDSS